MTNPILAQYSWCKIIQGKKTWSILPAFKKQLTARYSDIFSLSGNEFKHLLQSLLVTPHPLVIPWIWGSNPHNV